MAKVNFTTEHMGRLKVLALLFLMAGTIFKGAISTSLNVFQLIHDTTVNSLRTLYTNLEKEIAGLKKLSKWDMNDYQQKRLTKLEEQLEFLDLLIGFKLYKEQVAENKKLIAAKKAELLELEDSMLKPEDRINKLKDELKELSESGLEEVAPIVTITETASKPVADTGSSI
jgi:uncharacterized protein (DUF342 family)